MKWYNHQSSHCFFKMFPSSFHCFFEMVPSSFRSTLNLAVAAWLGTQKQQRSGKRRPLRGWTVRRSFKTNKEKYEVFSVRPARLKRRRCCGYTKNHEKFMFSTVLLLFAFKTHYWWLVTWPDLTWLQHFESQYRRGISNSQVNCAKMR
jgi:hypothetical protein